MKRKNYEEKFDVDVTDDPSTGTTRVQDREKDEVKNVFNYCGHPHYITRVWKVTLRLTVYYFVNF